MLSNKRFYIAQSVGSACAHSHFIMYLNPKFRGPNFTWDRLKDMSGLVGCQVALAGNFGKDLREMERVAVDHYEWTVEHILKESDIRTWMPL
jgi:hypothetical protein